MARPRKEGIVYFPFDCCFFEDDKIEYTLSVAGPEAVLGFQRLLCAIYQKGLCWRFGEMEKVAYAARSRAKLASVNKWLECWLACRLFDPEVYAATGYLTSKAVQRQYLEIVKRRVELKIPDGVLLLHESEIPADLTISFIIKDKEKVKGNPGFPHISVPFLRVSVAETPKMGKLQEKNPPGHRKGAKKFGDHVWITPEEYQNLVKEFGKKHVHAKISGLEAHISNEKSEYVILKNHYKTILNWLRNDAAQEKICVTHHPEIKKTSRHEAKKVIEKLGMTQKLKEIL